MYSSHMARRRRIVRIVLEPEEGAPAEWYVATSPDLPGLVTHGRGVDATIKNVKGAMIAYFEGKPPAYTLDVRVLVPV